MNNNICIARTDGFYDYQTQWFEVEALEDIYYEDLCEDMGLVSDAQYLVVVDGEGAIARELIKCTGKGIIDSIVDIMDNLRDIHMDIDTASELLDAGADYDELSSMECVGSSMDDYIGEIIDMWGIPENAKFYIDEELLKRDLNIESTFYETETCGLWMYI